MAVPFTIGVFGIILDEQERVLLVHRNDYDLWNLPGGGLEEREAPREGCIREVKEETGLDVEIERLLGVYSKMNKSDIVMNFLCRVVGGSLTLNEEARDLQYFALDNLPHNMVIKQVERIHDYFSQGESLVMKKQGGASTISLIKAGKL